MQSSWIQLVKLASLPWESTVSAFQILKLQVATRLARHLCKYWGSKLLSSHVQGKHIVPWASISALICHLSRMDSNIMTFFKTVLVKPLLCFLSPLLSPPHPLPSPPCLSFLLFSFWATFQKRGRSAQRTVRQMKPRSKAPSQGTQDGSGDRYGCTSSDWE